MHKKLLVLLAALLLSSCSDLQLQNKVVEQGNIITPEMTQKLHLGMSEASVKAIMGNPLLVNIFTPGRVDYVYTYRKGNSDFRMQRVTCIFVNGRLSSIQTL